jgi:broad specificity phosphatase PhoE
MATIYLVRHGQASFGEDDYDRLSELGRRQAQVLGEYFADAGIRLDAVYSGDLSRQRDTASLCLAAQGETVPHSIDPRFNEVQNDEQIRYLLPIVSETNPAIGALMEKGLSDSKSYQKLIEAVFNYWVSPDCDDDRLQSWADYSGSVRDALADVMAREGAGKTVAIFASGGTIATMVAQVLGLDGGHTYRFYEPMMNCSVTQLFYSGPKVSLSYYNDCSYLQLTGARQGERLVTYR